MAPNGYRACHGTSAILSLIFFTIALNGLFITGVLGKDCDIPFVIRGSWFYREDGEYFTTEINADSMTGRGNCLLSNHSHHVNYTFIFHDSSSGCYHCVQLFVRTVNILEKLESGCKSPGPGQTPSVENICSSINPNQQLITLFAENFVPVNCRSGLEGVWQFAYQNRFRFTGECNNPSNIIQSCQTPGSQFLITNQKFTINYKKCEGMSESNDGFQLLGRLVCGKNHFFAVANTKDSRKDEKFRCFLKNRDDDIYLGKSITPECNTLKSPEESPERYRLTPVKSEAVVPNCLLPQNFSGSWINTANIDADVSVNLTHIVETCQKDYVCFDFMPRHQNVIRYRKGIAMIKDDFHTVCSWTQFPSKDAWKYDLLLARDPVSLRSTACVLLTRLTKDPVPIRCPVAGKFRFEQKGDIPFETRILGGITESPRPDIYCKENVSDFSVCDGEQKEIWIKENYCLSVDYKGRPVDIYSDPDYKLKCIGYWKENLKSYLITYDEWDAFSRYRCWVYQRSDLTAVLMSQSLGPYCTLSQDVTSSNYTEGAAVSLAMHEYERERDQCPMNFDDGSDPWSTSEAYIQTFRFRDGGASSLHISITAFLLPAVLFCLLGVQAN
nr:EOG090X03AK [Eulimnadia texana]